MEDLEKSDHDQRLHEGKRIGGIRTMPFIFSNEISEKLAVVGFSANMISYLTQQLHMPLAKAATTLTNFSGTASLTPLLGAFLADAYIGRFWTITVGSLVYQIGMMCLTASAVISYFRPPPCSANEACKQASTWQLSVLYGSLLLTAVGAGGIRPCVVAFGADQFDESDPKEKTKTWNFFNWYYFCMGVSMLLAVTVVVYIQDNVGWGWGLGIPTIAMAISVASFVAGYPLYRRLEPSGSPFTRLAQVVVAAIKKRNLALVSDPRCLYENDELDATISLSGKLHHTEHLRMKHATVLCIFDGEVTFTSNAYQVNGGRARTIMLPNKATYSDLVRKVHEGGRLPMEQFEIKIKVIYQSIYPVPPIDISDDSDVECFLNHHLCGNLNTLVPLLVTSVPKDIKQVNENVLNVDHLQAAKMNVRFSSKFGMQTNKKDVHTAMAKVLPVDCISSALPAYPKFRSTQDVHGKMKRVVQNINMDSSPVENIESPSIRRSCPRSDSFTVNAFTNKKKEFSGVEDAHFGVFIEDYCPVEDYSPADDYCHVEPIATPSAPKVENFENESSPVFGGFNLNEFPPELDEPCNNDVLHRGPSVGCEAIDALFHSTDDETIVPETIPSNSKHRTKQKIRRKGKSSCCVEGKSKIHVEEKAKVKHEDTSVTNWIEMVVPKEENTDYYVNRGENVQLVLNCDHKKILLDQVFVDKNTLVNAARKYALYSNMMFKTLYSSKSRYTIACVVPTCPWRLHASRIAETKLFKITSFAIKHDCSIPIRGVDHKQATSKFICDFIKQRFHTEVAYSPLEIIRDVSLEFGVKLSYRKAWLAREKAIELRRGTYAESYGLLIPYFHELRKQNPGTITKICRDGQRFLRAFVAFAPCVSAFRNKYIRPVIAIDASHMKSKYRGVCFTATSLDGHNQLFQVAVGVGEAENNDSWNWFLTNLKDAIGDIPRDLVIISDRH